MRIMRLLGAITLCLSFFGTSHAAVVDLVWDGRLTLVEPAGSIVIDNQYAGTYGPADPGSQVPIQGTVSFDTLDPINTASMSIESFNFFTNDASIYDINFLVTNDPDTGRFLAIGNMLVDYGVNTGIPVSTVWDIQGLVNAILNPNGLQAGDTIVNNQLLRDGAVLVGDLDSASPATDGMVAGISHVLMQGPTPMATTTWNTTDLCVPSSPASGDCLGVNPTGGLPLIADTIAGSPMIDGPFYGISVSIDVGSGGMTVVPVPAAIWLFGFGLLGLIGMARRKQ